MTRCSTSCADAPGMLTKTSSMGTTICGSSSRGVCQILNRPSKSAATITSGVSGETMNACAMVPARPRFTRASSCAVSLTERPSFRRVPACLDSAPPRPRHSVRTKLQTCPRCSFRWLRLASAAGLHRRARRCLAVGRGPQTRCGAPATLAFLLAEKMLVQTCRIALRLPWEVYARFQSV